MIGAALAAARAQFLVGLLAIDALAIAAFGFAGARAPEAPPATEVAEATRASDAGGGVLWKGVDPAALGKTTAELYLAARKRIGRSKRVLLAAPRRVGDDVEIRVSIARIADGKGGLGFPPATYCFHCPMQRCLFPAPTHEAMSTLAEAFPAEQVRAVARAAGAEHVLVTYIGGASGGPVVMKAESQSCEGTEARTDLRVPPAYDIYDDGECGAHRCELSGSGDTIDVGDGYIDDNRKLACLRAMCTSAAAGGMGDVPVRYVGELAFEQGGAYRGAEVVVTLRGIGAAENGDAYTTFWSSLTSALEAP